MLQRVLQLVSTQPQLLAEHAEAYAELLGTELGDATDGWKRQALLNAAALCGLGVAAVLAGVALMLWAVLPAAGMRAPWALVVAPLLPAAAALACFVAAHRQRDTAFDKVRQQIAADLAMLREASGS